ncbi:RNA pseudouridine synthase 1-like isoform X1 [Zingiber officinale]|uniref:RNA pseudouridine synthase 1-like isoform X1 n=1 Tax=Zingiber officinale TaxID=94328 RepID=UPI001C4C39FF|nr:RNA pseudouridine synthase 1-like isoform X1 [Zingiber officinale]
MLLFPLRSGKDTLISSFLSARVRYPAMEAGSAAVDKSSATLQSSADAVPGSCYPIPLSPPYPPLSKSVELRRAMSATARSGGYALSFADIVFEDQYLAVANKPAGVYCEAILSSIASSTSSGDGATEPELHMANRLDRDTSGLMVITKSHKAAGRLVKAFTEHKVQKTYLALCVGCAPNWDKISISSGHGRSKFGAWRVYSANDVGRPLPGGSTVKHMLTSFEVLFVNWQGKFGDIAQPLDGGESVIVQKEGERVINTADEKNHEVLVRAYPQSGRTHQIRLHCQYLGLPIMGDVKYGGVLEWEGVTCDAHALHAESLSFDHPITGVPLRIKAPLPSWARKVCKQMQQNCP